MNKLNIAVVGAGLIGRVHIAHIQNSQDCQLCALVDPDESGRTYARQQALPWYPSLAELLAAGSADGIILATPNHLHVEQALLCVAAGVPALIEKPVAHTIEDGRRLLAIATADKVPLLVGHHRMHSPIMREARAVIASGQLGELVAVTGNALFYKPDDYFAAGPWRTRPGGGPILINMIHEIGNLRYLCGDITAVQAMASNQRRGFAVEDTVGIVMTFASGVIATFVLSDTAASAQSWEQTTQENPDYASYPDENCYYITGTNGSLAIPTMRIKRFNSCTERSWYKPMSNSRADLTRKDPLQQQLQHFCQVIRGEVEPLVSVRDGLQNLMVTEAIAEAATAGKTVNIPAI